MIRKLFIGFLIYLIGGFPTLVYALPQGGEVVSGTVGINSPNANNMAINQGSNQAIVNWQGFDIGKQESVTINQPNSNSVILNRVVGENPSAILGKLSANGQVFLTNPSGILFGQGAQVNVGALVASTLNISNQDFLDRNYRFTQDKNKPLASIINLGDINAGSVGLLAPRVENRGTIVASLGSVAIASGEKTALDFEGDGLINFEITQPVNGEIRDADGNILQSGVINSGLIQANGGQVVLSALQAQGMIQSVVNNEGMIEAKGVEERDGKIFLLGADEIINEGTLDVSGEEPGQTGGEIRLLGESVSVKSGILNASGDAGGGTVLIGGDRQGQNSNIQNAKNTTVAESASIKADAINSGDGGKIIVWADDSTSVHGILSATGGAQSGNGGFVETSGKNSLNVTSAPDVSAKNGKAGTWLLDPTNIEIVSGPGNGDGSQVSVTTIETALNAGSSVHIITSGQGLEEGTITVSTAIVKSSGGDTSLTLTAHGDIIVNQSITSTSGALAVNLISGADIFVNAAIVTNGGNLLADAGATNLPANISGSYMPAARISGAAVVLPKIEVNADITTGGGSVTLGQFKTKTHSLIGGGTYTKENIAKADIFIKNSTISTSGGNFKTNGGTLSITQPSIINTAAGDITFDSNIGTPTLTLSANSNSNASILLNSTPSITIGSNSTLMSSGGDITLTSNAADLIVLEPVLTINIEEDASITTPGGNILIDGGDNSIVLVAGNLNVSNGSGKGGTIQVLGTYVGIQDEAELDASGDEGGGTILVGGDYQGKNEDVRNAERAFIAANASLKADAITTGNGGKVILWADDIARFYGSISAQGGSISGDGGFVETSGKNYLDAQGYVNTLAVNGNIGTWLLDPKNITVTDGGGAVLGGVDQFLDSFNSTITIDAATINAAGANVVLQASNDITIDEAISISTAGITLTLQAGRSVLINQNITTNNAALTIVANETVANGVVDAQRDAGIAVITMADGTTLNAGTNNVILTMSTGPTTNNTSGDITIENIMGDDIFIDNNGTSAGSDILIASADSLITATTVALAVDGTGSSVGTSGNRIRVTVTNLEAIATSGGVFLDSIGQGLQIGAAALGSLTGITTTAGGEINVTSAGTINIADAMSGSAAITLDANGTNSDIAVNASIITTSGAITLTADDSISGTAGGDITATGTGALSITANANSSSGGDGGDVITMFDGAEWNAGSGLLSLTAHGSITIGKLITTSTSSTAVAVSSSSGGIIDGGDTGGDDIEGNSGTVNLTANTGIGSAGAIEVDTAILAVDANESIQVANAGTLSDLSMTLNPATLTDSTYSITSTGLTLSISDSAANVNIAGLTSTGNLNFTLAVDTGNLTTSGAINVQSGNFTVTTSSGSQTYSNTIAANNVTLNADGANSDVNINAAITTASGGAVTITADDSIIFAAAGDITAGGAGNISVTANTNNASGDSFNQISMNAGTTIDAGSGTITFASTGINAGTLNITGLTTTNSSDTAVTLNTNSSITDAGDTSVDIVATNGRIVMTANIGIGDSGAIEITASSIDAVNSVSNSIAIAETDSISIQRLANSASGANITFTANAGTITIASGGSGVTSVNGDINITATGTTSDLLVNKTITSGSGGGQIELKADDDITLTSGIDLITPGTGNLFLVADNDTDNTGAISGTGELKMNGGALKLVAGSGIGTSGTTLVSKGVTSFAASTNSGGIFLTNTGTAGVALNATTVDSLVGVTATSGDITISNTSGNFSTAQIVTATGSTITISAINMSFNSGGILSNGGVDLNATGTLNVSNGVQIIADNDANGTDTLSVDAVGVTLNGSSSGSENLKNKGGGAITISSSGDVSLDDNSIGLSSGGALAILAGTNRVFTTSSTGPLITLSTGGSLRLVGSEIGTSTNPIFTTGLTKLAGTATSGGFYLTNNSITDVNSNTIGGSVGISASGNIIIKNPLGGFTFTDLVSSSNGSITLETKFSITDLNGSAGSLSALNGTVTAKISDSGSSFGISSNPIEVSARGFNSDDVVSGVVHVAFTDTTPSETTEETNQNQNQGQNQNQNQDQNLPPGDSKPPVGGEQFTPDNLPPDFGPATQETVDRINRDNTAGRQAGFIEAIGEIVNGPGC